MAISSATELMSLQSFQLSSYGSHHWYLLAACQHCTKKPEAFKNLAYAHWEGLKSTLPEVTEVIKNYDVGNVITESNVDSLKLYISNEADRTFSYGRLRNTAWAGIVLSKDKGSSPDLLLS